MEFKIYRRLYYPRLALLIGVLVVAYLLVFLSRAIVL